MLENKEIWKDCKGYEGRYQISNLGRIWSVLSQKYLSTWLDSWGYPTVQLSAANGKRKTEKVHRLVALAFIPNPDGLPQVNHKNEDKADNRVENLEWCDNKYNSNYGTRNQRISETETKEYYCVELDRVFKGVREVEEELGIKGHHISEVCNGKRKTCGGYHWRWSDATDA